jgi:hypothetical protein
MQRSLRTNQTIQVPASSADGSLQPRIALLTTIPMLRCPRVLVAVSNEGYEVAALGAGHHQLPVSRFGHVVVAVDTARAKLDLQDPLRPIVSHGAQVTREHQPTLQSSGTPIQPADWLPMAGLPIHHHDPYPRTYSVVVAGRLSLWKSRGRDLSRPQLHDAGPIAASSLLAE